MATPLIGQDRLVGQTLGHYRITEKIGTGGMGEVYRAHDQHLDREVAIKVLPSGTLSSESSRKRFRKEALALSKLNHPNIATIHDFDTQAGVDFLVMEYIPGITLSAKLAGRPLLEKEVVNLGIQLAEGLFAAHEHGVVHRDLKPGNLRLSEDRRLKILDFGLAKLRLPVTASATMESLSETQAVAGTMPYMAPEQLLGGEIDARSDIHAAGSVLYEMATGQRPFSELEHAQLIGAILRRAPAPPRQLNRKVSPELERIIAKCLEKEPENRYQSANELAVDLRRLSASDAGIRATEVKRLRAPLRAAMAGLATMIAAAVLLVAFNASGWRDRLLGRATTPKIGSIAVLPLANLSGDPQQEYFADGMTEELIIELSKISALKVTSRTSVLRYKGLQKPVSEIARELKVDALVEGSVLRSGNRVRITAQLIRTSTDKHIWAQSYDRDLRDVLSLHSEVARAIAQQVRISLTPAEQDRLGGTRPVIPESYEAYLRGRYYAAKFTREPLLKARDYLQQAIDKDPTYAPAYAELAHVYFKLAIASGPEQGLSSSPGARETLSRARAAAQNAVELDPTLAQAHTMLGMVSIYVDFHVSEGKRELERAVNMAPDSADALIHASLWRALTGETMEARASTAHALEVDPLGVEIGTLAGQVFFRLRDYDSAIGQLQKTLEIDSNLPRAYGMLFRVYEAKQMNANAIAAFQKVIALNGGTPQEIAAPGVAFANGGIRGFWLWRLQRLNEATSRSYDSPTERARLYALLGDKERALDLLEKAYQQRDYTVYVANVGYEFDSLRSDPRFQDLLRRMKLPQ